MESTCIMGLYAGGLSVEDTWASNISADAGSTCIEDAYIGMLVLRMLVALVLSSVWEYTYNHQES